MAGTNPKPKKVVVEAQGHFLKLSIKHPGMSHKPGPRGSVSSFSAASRKRMLETMARIDDRKAGFICFVTLTYPDRDGPPTALQTERDRQTFLKRFKRAHPESSAIWRREWKPRMSGEFAGVVFPHFHFLFFALPFVHHSVVQNIWSEVIQYGDYVRTEIKGIQNWRHALFYVGKYMSKVPKEIAPPAPACDGEGSPWEAPAQAGAGGAAACSLVYVSNLTAEQSKPAPSLGRSWGVFNRSKLPFGEKRVLNMQSGPWIEVAKDMARQVWPGVNDDPNLGFTLFLDDARGLLHDLGALGENDPTQFNEDGEYAPRSS